MLRPGFADSYHQATKHQPYRFAKSAGFMDWPNQPNPFLRYEGAPLVELPLTPAEPTPRYADLYCPGVIPPAPFNVNTLGCFLQYAMGIAAWKEYQGAQWELRCNPSSGNLHPTECYVLSPPLEGLAEQPGIYHYAVQAHGLEGRCALDGDTWAQLSAEHGEAHCFVGLSGVYWREAWKYGERAYRYCQLDAGHALAALAYSAAALGWRCVLLEATSEHFLGTLLGCQREEGRHLEEPERPEALCAILPGDHREAIAPLLDETATDAVAAAAWCGKPIRLSSSHHAWDIIGAVAEACAKPATEARSRGAVSKCVPPTDAAGPGAHPLILQRRSAQAMDGRTGMSREDFYGTLLRCMPNLEVVPWSAGPVETRLHLAIFVHRVADLTPGLYLLIRNPVDEAALREACNSDFEWALAPEAPEGLPLYFLAGEDLRGVAAQLSCSQDIAGDSAFSLGMIGRYRQTLDALGDWAYPWLYREAGMVGQVLYLEAEARGLQGTGIGCYFDDLMHKVLGLEGDAFQSMYHFTVGGALVDTRLRTLPPYPESRLRKDTP